MKSCLKCASEGFMDCIGPSCDKACTCVAKSCDKCSCTRYTPIVLKRTMDNINKKYYGLKPEPQKDMARFKKYAKRKSVKKSVKKSIKKLKNKSKKKSKKKSVRKNKL